MSTLVEQRVESLCRFPGAMAFARGLCRKHQVRLDDVLNMQVQNRRVRDARRELVVVVMHTLDLDNSEAARAFLIDRTSVQNAQRTWDRDRRAAHENRAAPAVSSC